MTINYLEDLRTMSLTGSHELGRDLDFQDDASYSNVSNKAAWTTGTGFPGIRTGYSNFTGQLDGKGFKIKNHYVNNAGSNGYVMLFGEISGNAIIKNLTLENSIINAYYAAGLTEDLSGNAVIDNVHVINATITGVSHASGIVAGYNESAVIRNCSFNGALNGGNYNGGMAANSDNTSDAIIQFCKSTGTITGIVNAYKGGIIGSQNSIITIEDCYSEMTIQAGNNAATIIGVASSFTTIRRCWTDRAAGNYTIYRIGSPSTQNNFYDSTATGLSSSQGATARTTVQMKQIATFTGWDISAKADFDAENPSVWFIDEGIDYPRLWWEYQPPQTVEYIITASAGENGSIYPVGDINVGEYESQEFIITPYTGYRISEVLIDGINDTNAVLSGTHVFENVIDNHTIAAIFEVKPQIRRRQNSAVLLLMS